MELIFLWFLYTGLKRIWPDEPSCGNNGNDVFIPFEDQKGGSQEKEVFEDRKEYYPYEHEDFNEF
ncbi:MAG: hypothetical protein DRQ46_04910 [Gammaproteobacteria bacterium]|nr:MAG: hypothetical protein DRQ46_04910 [Gammaproteobacteria bacterium]